ncbi:hypothetical protein Y032_0075g967 [Ancylostoma ceylanicum]|nr:hypothetical protein Y032_0075g967 [Ancylostoma ceylanicum]
MVVKSFQHKFRVVNLPAMAHGVTVILHYQTTAKSTSATVPPEPTTKSSTTTSMPTKPRTQSTRTLSTDKTSSKQASSTGTTTKSTTTRATVQPELTTESPPTTSTSTKPHPQSTATTVKSSTTTTTVPPEPITESSTTTSTPTKPRPRSIGRLRTNEISLERAPTIKTTAGHTTTTAVKPTESSRTTSTSTKPHPQSTETIAESSTTTATVPPEPTTESSTMISTSTKPLPEPTDSPSKLSCLAVADFYNFDLTGESEEVEEELINDVAEKLFLDKEFKSIGMWIYGHSRRFLSIDESLNNMYTNLQDFQQDLWDNDVVEVDKPLNTSDTIKVINQLEDPQHRANCLIFFSAQEDTSTLPQLDPNPSKSAFRRIVAIGFNDTDLQHVVVQPRGVALSIPMEYMGEDIKAVVNAILKKP